MRKSMLAGLLALTLVLSGCGGKGEPSASGSGSGNASDSASGSVSSQEPANIPTAKEVQTARKTLEDAVETLRTTGTLPGFEALVGNQFSTVYRYAITDIDGDGFEELLLMQDTGVMASMDYLVLDGRDGQLRAELEAFPSLTFYENGYVRADASHNQGLAGDFWPYALYRYDAESDRYQQVAVADAWDGSLHAQDYAGNPFPKAADVSGAGIVYYVAENGDLYGQDGAFAPAPMDQADFEKWEASWQGSGAVVEFSLENEIVTDDLLAENAAG